MTFDLTFFEDDDVTPFYGAGDALGVTEADFSTDPNHARPYLREVKNWSATEVDFSSGSSTLGGVTIEVVDKRTDPANQDSGILTVRLKDLLGRRCLLRRQDAAGPGMLTAFNGVVQSHAMGGSDTGLVVITVTLRDIRERERNQPLFKSNFVIFGEEGGQGPAINYGTLPGGGYLLEETGGYASFSNTGSIPPPYAINNFRRGDPAFGFAAFYGHVPVHYQHLDQLEASLVDVGWPEQATDGLFYFRRVRVQWRPQGSTGPWITLDNMPTPVSEALFTRPNFAPLVSHFVPALNTGLVYFSSFYESDIPDDGQPIEWRILAVDITEDNPFFWDGGTLGDLLREIYDGEHNPDAPLVQYNPSDMAAFQAATPLARFILREPVKDMREWVEQNIYAPIAYAPGFDVDKRISPVSWALPDNATELPIVSGRNLVPIGQWDHGSDDVINTVEFTYIREYLDPLKTLVNKKTKRFLGFGWKTGTTETVVPDPDDHRMPWQRLTEVEVHRDRVDIDSLLTFGAKKLAYKPVTIRAMGGADGRPLSGDSQDETGAQIAEKIGLFVLARFARGAGHFTGEVIATDAGAQSLREGSWVRMRGAWFPNYDTGQRGLREYMQVVAISDEDPVRRALTLISGNVPDQTADDDATGTLPGGEDCLALSGGTIYPAGPERAVRLFEPAGSYALVNDCDHPVDVELLLIGGGGGGGTAQGGGGGGAGGVLGKSTPITVTIPAGATVPITVGAGGAADLSGESTVFWMHKVTGAILDPMTDPASSAYEAVGGGKGGASGAGFAGGSGGGGGANLPISGGFGSAAGAGISGQGRSGGTGGGDGGIATCAAAAGGGGGSFAGAGQPSIANTDPSVGIDPGGGGPSSYFEDWGVLAGGGGGGGGYAVNTSLPPGLCAQGVEIGSGGSGAGAGGGGGGGPTPVGGAGSAGLLAVRYAGPIVPLTPVDVTSSTTTEQNQQTICVEGSDWPPGAVEGYRVRVEYATGDVEPDPASGLWTFAGYLEAPGCLTTPPLPTGAKVWSRAVAEATSYLPAIPGTSGEQTSPETPGLLALAVRLDDQGIGTITWIPNAFCGAVQLRGEVHEPDDPTPRPLPLIASVDADASPYTVGQPVPAGDYLTVDVVAFEDATYTTEGRTYRASVEMVPRGIADQNQNLDFMADVEYPSEPVVDQLLQRTAYGQWVNVSVEEALARYLHHTRHELGGDDVIKLDDLGTPDDNTDLDATTGRHGLLPKLGGGTSDFLRADGSWAAPPGLGSNEYSVVAKSADQDVTNNAALQNDSELSFPVSAGEVYEGVFLIVYSGTDANAEYQFEVACPQSEGWMEYRGARTTADAFLSGQGRFGPTATTFGIATAAGTRASFGLEMLTVRFMVAPQSSGNVTWQFCNNVAAVGRTSRTEKGSLLLYRRLPT